MTVGVNVNMDVKMFVILRGAESHMAWQCL